MISAEARPVANFPASAGAAAVRQKTAPVNAAIKARFILNCLEKNDGHISIQLSLFRLKNTELLQHHRLYLELAVIVAALQGLGAAQRGADTDARPAIGPEHDGVFPVHSKVPQCGAALGAAV